jgi:hypothetical protein
MDDVRALIDRLERDYGDRVRRHARGFGTWASGTQIGIEIPLGRRIGPMAGWTARYAERRGLFGIAGPRQLVRDLDAIEVEFRSEIESWLRARELETR